MPDELDCGLNPCSRGTRSLARSTYPSRLRSCPRPVTGRPWPAGEQQCGCTRGIENVEKKNESASSFFSDPVVARLRSRPRGPDAEYHCIAARCSADASHRPGQPIDRSYAAESRQLNAGAAGRLASYPEPHASRTDGHQEQPRISVAHLLALAQHQVVRESRAGELPTIAGNITAVDAEDGSRLSAGTITASRLFEHAAAGGSGTQLITDFGRTRNLIASRSSRKRLRTRTPWPPRRTSSPPPTRHSTTHCKPRRCCVWHSRMSIPGRPRKPRSTR